MKSLAGTLRNIHTYTVKFGNGINVIVRNNVSYKIITFRGLY